MALRDTKGRPLVAVTGMGVVTSLGQGKDDTWAALTAGKSGIHRIERFPTEGLRTTIAGTIDSVDVEPFCAPVLSERLAMLAAEEAVGQSGLAQEDFPGALFIAVPPVEMEWPQREALAEASGQTGDVTYKDLLTAAATGRFKPWHDLFIFGTVADRVADRFGTKGSPISLSTACSSGATAIQLGVEAIRRGETDAALCIGTDGSVNPEVADPLLAALGALDPEREPGRRRRNPSPRTATASSWARAARRSCWRTRTARRRAARKSSATCSAAARRATASTAPAPRRTACPPSPRSAQALDDAGLTPDEIDYINAHGTSTPENDKMEAMSCTAVFGERMAHLPISSNKSMIGHTLTAAGAVEAVMSLLTIATGRIPPTINHQVPDPAIPLDVVPNVARDASVNYVLSNSFGFGGQNTCLVFGAEPKGA